MTKHETQLKGELGVLRIDNEKLTREIQELKHNNTKLTEDF